MSQSKHYQDSIRRHEDAFRKADTESKREEEQKTIARQQEELRKHEARMAERKRW